MKRILLALALALGLPSAAFAQCNGVFPSATVCGNPAGPANIPHALPLSSFALAPGGSSGQIQTNNGAGGLGAMPAMNGDATLNTTTGALTLNTVPPAKGGTGANNSTNAAGDVLASNGTNGNFVHTALVSLLNTACTAAPSLCTTVLGYTNVAWYGTANNAVVLSTGTASITSGTKNLTVTAAAFTSADVGKSMWIPHAGPAGAGYSTTITTFTDAIHVVVNDNASTTITAQALGQAAADMMVYGTDDTAAINAAFAGTPAFGTLYLAPTPFAFPVRGYLIKQSGATGRSLLLTNPINITGGGNGSMLVTDPSMGSTILNIHVLVSGVTWKGITWQGFGLGTDTNFTNFPRFGTNGIWFDATSAGPGGFTGVTWQNLSLGESPSGSYSFLLDGVGTQGNRIDNNFIVGGVSLSATADSNQITRNRLLGVSNFGIRVDTPTAGGFEFSGNSTTLAAGFCILNGSSITLSKNFFEEQTASGTYAHNAQMDIGCSSGQAMSAVSVYGNIITAGLSNANNIKVDANVGFTWIYANETATRVAANASITNANATTYCGPNQIITASPHLTGTAPVLWGVAAC
jgi:hypothetical protein